LLNTVKDSVVVEFDAENEEISLVLMVMVQVVLRH
jgi:hypothetical protein